MSTDAYLAQRMRKGAGLLRRDIATLVPPETKNKWHIGNDEFEFVRAKAIWCLERCLRQLVGKDTKDWELVCAAYNSVADDTLNHLALGERLKTVAPRLGMSVRTAERRLKELDIPLNVLLEGPLPAPPAAELQEIINRWPRARRAEVAASAAPKIEHIPLETLIPAVHGSSWDQALAKLLDTDVHVPIDRAGQPIIGTTRSKGSWAYGFTQHELLVEFQLGTQPTWVGNYGIALGSDLINWVHKTSYYTGLLINPPARRDRPVKNTLGIDPLQLAMLAKL